LEIRGRVQGVAKAIENARLINPRITVLPVSARSGEGLAA
jgi:hypothetical protein